MEKITAKKLDGFFKKYKELKFKKGEVLIEADTNPGLFYLQEGVVKQFTISKKGEEQTINLFKSPALFPVAGVINGTNNSHYFEAITPVSVRIAPKQDALKFLKSEPEILFDLLQKIYRGLDGFFVRMENLMNGNSQDKLITELIIYAKRFGIKRGEKIVIDLKLTESQLASQAGVSRETVSREISRLKTAGLITFDKNLLTINNLQKLESH